MNRCGMPQMFGNKYIVDGATVNCVKMMLAAPLSAGWSYHVNKAYMRTPSRIDDTVLCFSMQRLL